MPDKYKILIADDDPDLLFLMQTCISQENFDRPIEVITAISEKETYKQLREHPDTAILITDLKMEKMVSGKKIAEFIRYQMDNWEMRIVYMTGDTKNFYIDKPYNDIDISGLLLKGNFSTASLIELTSWALKNYDEKVSQKKNRETNIKLTKMLSLLLNFVMNWVEYRQGKSANLSGMEKVFHDIVRDLMSELREQQIQVEYTEELINLAQKIMALLEPEVTTEKQKRFSIVYSKPDSH